MRNRTFVARGMSFAVVFGVLFCAGCVVTKVHTMPTMSFSAPYEDVWDSAALYLQKEKEPVLSFNRDDGVISTDWVHMHKVFSVKRYRYDIKMDRLEDGGVQVTVVSPQEGYSMGDWEELLPSERRARRIFRFIQSNIRRVAAGGRLTGSSVPVGVREKKEVKK